MGVLYNPINSCLASLRIAGKVAGLNARKSQEFWRSGVALVELHHAVTCGLTLSQQRSESCEIERRTASMKLAAKLQCHLEVDCGLPHRRNLSQSVDEAMETGQFSSEQIANMARIVSSANSSRHRSWKTSFRKCKLDDQCSSTTIPSDMVLQSKRGLNPQAAVFLPHHDVHGSSASDFEGLVQCLAREGKAEVAIIRDASQQPGGIDFSTNVLMQLDADFGKVHEEVPYPDISVVLAGSGQIWDNIEPGIFHSCGFLLGGALSPS